MGGLWLASYIALWLAVLGLGFVVLGLLRQYARLGWRVDQLQARLPHRIGRDGLLPGRPAPEFELSDVQGTDVRLRDLLDRRLLLVFTQPGCGPCDELVPALNRLTRDGEVRVAAVSSGDRSASRDWAREHGTEFPVLCQEDRAVSRRYEVIGTPFAFLVDQRGAIAAKGVVNTGEHLRFLIADAETQPEEGRLS